MRNRRPGSIADRLFCARSPLPFHIRPFARKRGGRGGSSELPTWSEISKKSVSGMVASGASPSGDRPTSLRKMQIDRRIALAAFGSMAAAIAVMLLIAVWGYMS